MVIFCIDLVGIYLVHYSRLGHFCIQTKGKVNLRRGVITYIVNRRIYDANVNVKRWHKFRRRCDSSLIHCMGDSWFYRKAQGSDWELQGSFVL